jgi:hypothetical protein
MTTPKNDNALREQGKVDKTKHIDVEFNKTTREVNPLVGWFSLAAGVKAAPKRWQKGGR